MIEPAFLHDREKTKYCASLASRRSSMLDRSKPYHWPQVLPHPQSQPPRMIRRRRFNRMGGMQW